MREYYDADSFEFENTAVTLGKFDGLHVGHKELVNRIMNAKKTEGLKTVLFSFDTSKIRGQKSITTIKERAMVCERLGIDEVVFYPVNSDTMSMKPEEFIKKVLVDKMGAKLVVTGRDFCFGKDRAGTVDTLMEFSDKYGYRVELVSSVKVDNERVSSSGIKEYIAEGKIEEANKRLGYRYFMNGMVKKGRQIGRTIDTRTANIIPDINKICPKNGVYKTKIMIDGKEYKSITNVGICPTVNDLGNLTVETHIFEFNGDIYDKEVNIFYEKFIRNEQKFNNLEELKTQISLDILEANL